MNVDVNIYKLSDLYKNLSDYNRLKLLLFLLDGEKDSNEIADYLDVTRAIVVHQLMILKEAKFIGVNRIDKKNYYFLQPHILRVFKNDYSVVKKFKDKKKI